MSVISQPDNPKLIANDVDAFYSGNTDWRNTFGQDRKLLEVSHPNDKRLSSMDQLIYQFSRDLPENARIVDLGPSPVARDIIDIKTHSEKANKNQRVTGVELVIDNIKFAQSKDENLKGSLSQGNVQSTPIKTDSCDGALLSSVIQYIKPGVFFEKVLPEIHHILKPGGTFLLIFKSTQGKDEYRSFF